MLTPEVIILGGGLVEALSQLYLEEVKKVVSENVLECYEDICKIKIAELGDDAGAIGAGLWAAGRYGHLSKSDKGDTKLDESDNLAHNARSQ
jgi:predicted NBD/HSP70 family sugar kinase